MKKLKYFIKKVVFNTHNGRTLEELLEDFNQFQKMNDSNYDKKKPIYLPNCNAKLVNTEKNYFIKMVNLNLNFKI